MKTITRIKLWLRSNRGLLDKQGRRALAHNRWWTVALALLVILVLGVSLSRDWDTLREFDWRPDWLRLVMQAGLHVLALSTMFLAWHYTIHRLAGKANWLQDFRIYAISILARRIPLPIWYVGSRVVLYQVEGVSARIVLAATTFEIGLIGISGVLCYVLLLPFYIYSQSWPWEILASLAALISIALLIRPSLFVDGINAILRLRKRPLLPAVITRKDLLAWSGFYLATWFLDGLGLYFTVTAFLPNSTPVASIVGVSTVSALIALATMILPSGFGLKELAMGAMLQIWMPLSAGVVISILYRLIQTFVEIILVFMGQSVLRKANKGYRQESEMGIKPASGPK
jgi:hypothetical protein